MPVYQDIEENFKRGVIDMIILKLLSQADMYAYQMASVITEQSGGKIEVKLGTVYGPLYRMIDRGYISERKELVGKRRTRVYYHIESAGLEYLNMSVEIYCNINDEVQKIITGEKRGQKNE